MAKRINNPSNGTEKMAAQIDEIHSRISVLENLISDISPNIEKISKELSPTLNELRERFERDETLTLIKKLGDNIPTLITLINVLEGVKGMAEDFLPNIEKISKELSPTLNELRKRYESDDLIKLIKMAGDNIPTLITLINVLDGVKGMGKDFLPNIEKISKELSPTLNELRERFERDEVITIIKKIGDSLPFILQIMDTAFAIRGMAEDLAPAQEKIAKELQPTINMLREAFEKEELLEILKKSGKNIDAIKKMIDFLDEFNLKGFLDHTLNFALAKETTYLMRGLEDSAVVTMKQFEETPFRSGFRNIVALMRNREVQKGFIFFFTLIGNMYDYILATISEDIMKEIIEEEAKK